MTIQTMPTVSTHGLVALRPIDLTPMSRKKYWPAICDWLAIASRSDAIVPQPPAYQPVFGPSARAAQVKDEPQSGSARFISLFAQAEKNIGMNASGTSSSVCGPTVATTKPRVAARL